MCRPAAGCAKPVGQLVHTGASDGDVFLYSPVAQPRMVGELVGDVEGALEGDTVGDPVAGLDVGDHDGASDGLDVGNIVGLELSGLPVGFGVGSTCTGACVGLCESKDGHPKGSSAASKVEETTFSLPQPWTTTCSAPVTGSI